jgi:hypothetical protein
MKKVAIVKDALRNMPHLIILEEDQQIKSIPVTEFGKKIAEQSIINSSINTKSIPDGFLLTKFNSVTPEIESFIKNGNFEQNIDIYEKAIKSKTIKIKSIRVKNMQKVAIIGIAEKSLSSFKTIKEKESIIDFKTRLFLNNIKTSSIISLVKSGKIALDKEAMEVKFKKSLPLSELTAELVQEQIPHGVRRRAFNLQEKELEAASSKRLSRRAKSLSAEFSRTEVSGVAQRIYKSPLSRLRQHG